MVCEMPLSRSMNEHREGSQMEEQIARQINEMLQAFQQDPVGMMDRRPIKRDVERHAVEGPTAFSAQDVQSGRFVMARDDVRKKFAGHGGTGRCPRRFSERRSMARYLRPRATQGGQCAGFPRRNTRYWPIAHQPASVGSE